MIRGNTKTVKGRKYISVNGQPPVNAEPQMFDNRFQKLFEVKSSGQTNNNFSELLNSKKVFRKKYF